MEKDGLSTAEVELMCPRAEEQETFCHRCWEVAKTSPPDLEEEQERSCQESGDGRVDKARVTVLDDTKMGCSSLQFAQGRMTHSMNSENPNVNSDQNQS